MTWVDLIQISPDLFHKSFPNSDMNFEQQIPVSVRIPDMLKQKFETTHADPLQKLTETLSQDSAIHKAISMTSNGFNTSAAGQVARTMASPEWNGGGPVNWRRNLTLSAISASDFDASNTCHVFHRFPCIFSFPIFPL